MNVLAFFAGRAVGRRAAARWGWAGGTLPALCASDAVTDAAWRTRRRRTTLVGKTALSRMHHRAMLINTSRARFDRLGGAAAGGGG